jgi:hypothetical protein
VQAARLESDFCCSTAAEGRDTAELVVAVEVSEDELEPSPPEDSGEAATGDVALFAAA